MKRYSKYFFRYTAMKNILLLIILLLPTRIIAGDLVVEARLLDFSKNTPHCGTLYVGSVAVYGDVKVINGHYDKTKIFVIHGCIELLKKEYFIINTIYRLSLTMNKPKNIIVLSSKLIIEDNYQLYYSKDIKSIK